MQQPHILVIDDDDIIRLNLEIFLEDEGYQVHTANSGEAGLALLKQVAIDLCVTDIRLPGMSGNQFIIQSHQAYPGLRYIIHTGSSEYSIPDTFRQMNIRSEHLLMKPLSNMGVLSMLIEKSLNLS